MLKPALLFCLLSLAGCQALYESGQASADHQCRLLPPGESADCLAKLNRKPYEEYEKERRAR